MSNGVNVLLNFSVAEGTADGHYRLGPNFLRKFQKLLANEKWLLLSSESCDTETHDVTGCQVSVSRVLIPVD